MKRISIITAFLLFSFNYVVFSQVMWTIEDCIEYALANNIGLQRQKLQTEIDQVNLTRSKMEVLPSLNFGTDARVGF